MTIYITELITGLLVAELRAEMPELRSGLCIEFQKSMCLQTI